MACLYLSHLKLSSSSSVINPGLHLLFVNSLKHATNFINITISLIILLADIYNVNTKQNKLLNIIEEKKTEISILREKGNINKRYPAIAQLNEVIGEYNTCAQIFPNNIYNKIILDKKTEKYLIR